MAQDCITIKGTRGGLLILLDASRDFNEIKANLAAKFAAARGFFRGAAFALVPTSPLNSQETAELEAICREHGLVPGNNITLPSRRRPGGNQAAHPDPVALTSTGLPTLLDEGNLRNGQEINYPGHVMWLGDVHQGATIRAGGNILIMGTLKGNAHAGSQGDRSAAIVAYRMEPEQLGIAGIIARSPEQKTRHPYPEIARLVGTRIVIDPYLSPKSSRN
ncbi:putative septum site-determining protein MinC [Moorella thermoacetica]|uniref:Probable septum site-determining protein MinC n=3 Tax=Neomoorella thermoacetica TaxID=1525 RepID=MINC_MOOTA|nr:septum site-determining protein MinC [Moorella thermoacetica]Q2RHC4.1 RecName: Full=Probable septum site-determining protein MinC [Moorella thermoacetica ATCC 39073]AKX94681.1 septum site-determining protein MinC [Moorella thermoacetica]AKX97314.1 septum site-determining protein MinC [Moorella thermoacetica]AOQ24825.1 Septum site-determining protein MinC [Moorella thermoacetica]OIQ09416.1 septum site-determining protein MinC [Moorella thermoacetica]OIQ57267.1 septum site-determining protei